MTDIHASGEPQNCPGCREPSPEPDWRCVGDTYVEEWRAECKCGLATPWVASEDLALVSWNAIKIEPENPREFCPDCGSSCAVWPCESNQCRGARRESG